MLTISDLNLNEELSSAEMGKVAGGGAKEAIKAWADYMGAAGFEDAASILKDFDRESTYEPMNSEDDGNEGEQ
jgi:hypothetical protein